MKRHNRNIWVTALSVGVLATVVALPQAKGELVYEDPVPQATAPQSQATVVQTQQIQQVPVLVTPIQAQPVQVAPAQPSQIQVGSARVEEQIEIPESRPEKMRRMRLKQEQVNRELIDAHLEERRLRAENELTKSVMSGLSGQPAQQQAPAMLQEEVVVAPVTENPGAPAPQAMGVLQAPAPVMAHAPALAPVEMNTSVAVSAPAASESSTQFSIQPRFGVNGMENKDGYTIRPRYAAGLGLSVASSESVSFEVGYTYSEYGVALATSNPYVIWAAQYGISNPNETAAMKQNVIDAGMKVHLLNSDATVRPFLGGGGAYSKNFINYDQRILSVLNRVQGLGSLAADYEVSQFLGYLSGGLDVKVSKKMTIGAVFKYYTVLSSRESSGLNNAALFGNTTYPSAGLTTGALTSSDTAYLTGLADPAKDAVGGSLAKNAFYSIMVGTTFNF